MLNVLVLSSGVFDPRQLLSIVIVGIVNIMNMLVLSLQDPRNLNN